MSGRVPATLASVAGMGLMVSAATGDYRQVPAPPPSPRGRIVDAQKSKGRRGAKARVLAMKAARHA